MRTDFLRVSNGLATLGSSQLAVLRSLDGALLDWAMYSGAAEMAFPPLTPVADLARVDYFINFPQLALAAAPLQPASFPDLAAPSSIDIHSLPSELLGDTAYVLPSAACYPVYSHLAEKVLPEAEQITTAQRCFRNESNYDGLERLWAFTMREIVCVGTDDDVRRFLARHKEWILRFAAGADVPLSVQVATDPFFDGSGARATMQRLFPVKEEFVYESSVAVSSVNFHRNFFAERWDIRTMDAHHAFSGCIAFGLERWYHVLASRYRQDATAMLEAICNGAERARGGEFTGQLAI